MIQRINCLWIIAFALVAGLNLDAQEINKEVYVVRPYEPTLSDATKYNFLPVTDDLETRLPRFEYAISPRRIENSFEPEPIKAAKTVTTSLPKIYKSWLKIGLGNYTTPMAEFNISNLRSKDLAYGAYLYHKSSYGNIRLSNDHKVPAGYAVNNISLYGKKFYTRATLSGNLRLDHQAFNYYGYNTALFSDPLPDMENDSIRQKTYLAGFDLTLSSNNNDQTQLNYNVSASVDYFFDRRYKENSLVIKAGLNKYFNALLFGLDLSLDNSNLKGATDSIRNTIFRFNPWISKQSEDWKFLLGFEAVADIANITNYYFYPRVNLDITIIDDVLVPFIGLSGELTKNNYRNIFSENQFVNPGSYLKNSSSNLIVYGGLKGSISPAVRFRADVSYTAFKNYHFFINDTLLPLENQFTAVYDDIDLITYHGQISVQPSGSFEVMLDGKYFDFSTYDQPKPWHKPDYRIGLDANYTYKNKFAAGVEFTLTGNRWVWNHLVSGETDKLNPVGDINLHLKYHYSKLLSVFADLYNLTDRSYMLWNQYPSQRFNFLLGFAYKL